MSDLQQGRETATSQANDEAARLCYVHKRFTCKFEHEIGVVEKAVGCKRGSVQ
jgi:hypothetical protein